MNNIFVSVNNDKFSVHSNISMNKDATKSELTEAVAFSFKSLLGRTKELGMLQDDVTFNVETTER